MTENNSQDSVLYQLRDETTATRPLAESAVRMKTIRKVTKQRPTESKKTEHEAYFTYNTEQGHFLKLKAECAQNELGRHNRNKDTSEKDLRKRNSFFKQKRTIVLSEVQYCNIDVNKIRESNMKTTGVGSALLFCYADNHWGHWNCS